MAYFFSRLIATFDAFQSFSPRLEKKREPSLIPAPRALQDWHQFSLTSVSLFALAVWTLVDSTLLTAD